MKKKKLVTRLLALSLTFVMAGGLLSGCGKTKSSSSSAAVLDKDHVYKAEYFNLPDGVENVNRMKVYNDKLYLDGFVQLDNGYNFQIFSINPDGTDMKIIYKQDSGANKDVNSYTVDNEGNLYLYMLSYEEDASDPENIQYLNKSFLVKMDAEGKEIYNNELKIKEDIYVNDMAIDKEGNIILLSYQNIIIYDKDGNEISNVSSDTNVDTAFVTEDGKFMVTEYSQDYTKRLVKEFLPGENKFSDPIEMEGVTNNYQLSNGVGYDLFMQDQTDLYGYDIETQKKTKIINWIDSDMNGSFVNSISGLSDGRIVAISVNWMKNTSEVTVLTKVPPEEVKDKEVLVLACVYANMNVNNAVIEFNKKSEKYRITVKDYSAYNTNEDYMAGSKKLNTDIISGDVPDLLSISDASSFNSFTSKGLFADFYELMDKDESFKKSDYLENIFTAFEKDGKLYSTVPFFDCFTVLGKTSDVGADMGWTMDDLEKVMAGKPEGTKIFNDMTRESIMYYGNYLCMDEYIDWKTNKANFEGESFVKLLEFANQFPSQEDRMSSTSMTEEASSTMDEYSEDDYRSGKTLLQISYLSSLNEFHRLQKVEFGEEVTFIGFPTETKNGSAISPGLQFAISAKSGLKDVAWEFIKTFYTDDFQDNLMWGWPTKLSSLEKKKEEAQKPQTYTDETGKDIVYEDTAMIDGKEVKIGSITDEEYEKVMTFFKSLKQIMRYDEKVVTIIDEETGAYFAGQKSAEEVAKLVQNRVQTYLSEIQ